MLYWISKQIPRTHSGKNSCNCKVMVTYFSNLGECDRTVIPVSEMQKRESRTALRFVSWTHYESCDFSLTVILKSLYLNAHCNALPMQGRKREKDTNAFLSDKKPATHAFCTTSCWNYLKPAGWWRRCATKGLCTERICFCDSCDVSCLCSQDFCL